jgi:4-amino-4-deoxy-L-arabinose transferase-like glycosyltransferase
MALETVAPRLPIPAPRRRAWDWTERKPDGVVAAVVALTVLAAAVRFASLGVQSYWGDEALTVAETRRPFDEMLGLVFGQETTPPLYFILAWGWAKVFGFGEEGLRSLSALAGTAMVPVAYRAAARLFSARAGVTTAALAAVNPFLIWYSQEARAYALYLTLAALSFLCFIAVLQSHEVRWAVSWGVVSALALTSHFFAVFLVGPEALWLLLATRGHRVAFAVRLAVSGVAATGCALLPVALADRAHGTTWISHVPVVERIGRTAGEFAAGPLARWSWFGQGLVMFAGLTAIGLAALGLGMRREQRRSAVLALVIGGLALAIPLSMAVLGADYVNPRNVAAAWLPLTVVAAAGLATRRAGRLGALGAAILCACSLAATLAVGVRSDLQRPNWRAVAADIGATASTRAVIADATGAEPLRLYLPDVTRHAAASRIVIEEIVLVRHVPSAGPHVGCRRLSCLPSVPPASLTPPANVVPIAVRHARVGDYAVARWSLRHPRRVTPGRLRRAFIQALDPLGSRRVLVVLQDRRA